MLKLYDFTLSGNCYKIRLLLSLLGLDCELIPVDLKSGEHKQPPFLQLNPLGQVPVFSDNEVVIWDSQAILVYIARRYGGETWLPLEAESMSKVVQWLSIAAKEIANSLASARRHYVFGANVDVEALKNQSHTLLEVIDRHLTGLNWLVGDRLTIADIACFPYIGLAGDAKVSLDAYPNVVVWIERIKQLPGYISMPGL